MKKHVIIFFVLLLGFCKASYSQAFEKGSYIPFPELSKFEGEWVYTQDGKMFKVILKKRKVLLDRMDMYMDQIEGYHSYTEKRITLQSSIGKSKSIVIGNFTDNDKKDKIRFSFEDLKKHKNVDGSLELLPGKTDEARWELTNREVIRINPTSAYDWGFSVPTNVIMRKVK